MRIDDRPLLSKSLNLLTFRVAVFLGTWIGLLGCTSEKKSLRSAAGTLSAVSDADDDRDNRSDRRGSSDASSRNGASAGPDTLGSGNQNSVENSSLEISQAAIIEANRDEINRVLACANQESTSLCLVQNDIGELTRTVAVPAVENLVQTTAMGTLQTYCAECHVPGSAVTGGDLDYIDNLDRLVTAGKIFPGQPAEDSLLYGSIVKGSMPPAGNKPTDPEMEVLRVFIENVLKPLDRTSASPQKSVAEYCAAPESNAVPAKRVWRMGRDQIQNSLNSILGLRDVSIIDIFKPGVKVTSFSNYAELNRFERGLETHLLVASEPVADYVVANQQQYCTNPGQSSCAEEFIDTYAKMLFHGTLSEIQRGELIAVYTNIQGALTAAPATRAHDLALKGVVQAVLNSPAVSVGP